MFLSVVFRRCRNQCMFVGYSGFTFKYLIGSPEISWKRDLILPLLTFIIFVSTSKILYTLILTISIIWAKRHSFWRTISRYIEYNVCYHLGFLLWKEYSPRLEISPSLCKNANHKLSRQSGNEYIILTYFAPNTFLCKDNNSFELFVCLFVWIHYLNNNGIRYVLS